MIDNQKMKKISWYWMHNINTLDVKYIYIYITTIL